MFLKNSAFALGRELRVDLWEIFRVFVWLSTIDKHRVRGVDSAKWPYNNLPGGVAQGHILIPVISSEFGVNGSGVEQNDGNGSSTSKSGLRNMQWKRRTSKKSRTCATFPNHVSVLSRMCVWRVPSNAEHWQDSEKCACDEVFCLRTANGVEMRLWSLGSGEFLSLWQTIYQRHSFEWISRGFDVSFPCIDDDKKAVGHRCLAWQNLAGLDAMGQTVVAAWFQDEPHTISTCSDPSLRTGRGRLRFSLSFSPYPFFQFLVQTLTVGVSIAYLHGLFVSMNLYGLVSIPKYQCTRDLDPLRRRRPDQDQLGSLQWCFFSSWNHRFILVWWIICNTANSFFDEHRVRSCSEALTNICWFCYISFLQKLPQQMPATLVQVVSHLFFLWWKKHVITHPRQSQWSLTAKMICSWYGKWSSIARTCGLWWANGVNSS